TSGPTTPPADSVGALARSAGRGGDEQREAQGATEAQPIAQSPRERGEGRGEGSAPPAQKRSRVSSRQVAPAAEPSPAATSREAALISEARQALRSGDPARALKLLEEC